ncbi:MAG: ABC transporter ATP-binding protein [Fimbriimonas sp.]
MSEPILVGSGVSVGYAGRVVASGIEIAARRGEVVALLGPNGSGKSTLLRTLAGLVPALSGSVLLGGAPIAKLAPRERAKSIGWVPQEENFAFRFSVREVVTMGRIAHSTGVFESAEDVAAAERAMETADCGGLADRVVADLSGGEKQRVLFARALAQESPVLLLDEPTAHLDPEHQVIIGGLIRSLAAEGKAIVVATHDLNLAQAVAHRALLLGDGLMQLAGEVAHVLADPKLEAVYRVRFWRQNEYIMPLH